MRASLSLVLIVLAALPAAARDTPPDERALAAAKGVNAFAVDLYKRLAAAEGNVFFSPFSISTALAMTREGAQGKTGAEMDRALHLPRNDLAKGVGLLRASLAPRRVSTGDGKKPSHAIQVANALWAQQGYPVNPGFLAKLKDSYGAPMERLDFKDAVAARKTINDWVAKRTRNRIKDILNPPHPAPDTRLALANAIHFQAKWSKPFYERGTRPQPFTRLDGKQVTTPLMTVTQRVPYVEDADVQAVELPYLGWQTSMVVVLPKKRGGLPALEKALTLAKLNAWTPKRSARVSTYLPRFGFTTGSLELKPHLKALGMPLAFTNAADFSGMSPRPLKIGAVIHKAFVAVDEKGTEAAAATVVLMAVGGAPPSNKPKTFRADHPFLFFIRHRKTGVILFVGRVLEPERVK